MSDDLRQRALAGDEAALDELIQQRVAQERRRADNLEQELERARAAVSFLHERGKYVDEIMKERYQLTSVFNSCSDQYRAMCCHRP